jgi:hypothetical protein
MQNRNAIRIGLGFVVMLILLCAASGLVGLGSGMPATDYGAEIGPGDDIATAVYHSSSNGDLAILRAFRDAVLLTNPVGEFLVNAYYTMGTPIAAVLQEHERLSTAVRLLLFTPLVYLAAIALNAIALGAFVLLVLLVLVVLHRHQRTILKGIAYGLLILAGGTVLVVTLGALGYELPTCAVLAAYVLPFLSPAAVAVCVLTWIETRRARCRTLHSAF